MAGGIQNKHGKVVNGPMPADVPSPAAVEERARELAEIDGRDPASITNQDRERALRELQGVHGRDAQPTQAVEDYDARDSSDPAGGRRERKPKYPAADESQQARDLSLQGVDEAEHEQMLQARRDRDRTEEQ